MTERALRTEHPGVAIITKNRNTVTEAEGECNVRPEQANKQGLIKQRRQMKRKDHVRGRQRRTGIMKQSYRVQKLEERKQHERDQQKRDMWE